MKNKLAYIVAASLITTGLAGCAGNPIIKEEKLLPRIEKNYIPPQKSVCKKFMLARSNFSSRYDCIGLIIALHDAHCDLITLTNIERDAIEGLKRKPNNPSDETDLEITQGLKRRIMEYRDNLSQDIEDLKCLEYKPLETIL